MRAWRWLAASWIVGSSMALAVEPSEIRIADRWAVVGVISSGEPKLGKAGVGIVVLRHNQSGRTYTVSLGDEVPREYGFVVAKIQKHGVIISDGRIQHEIGFAEASNTVASDDGETDSGRTARFIDNYYRGLNEIPIDILTPEGEMAAGREGATFSLPTFGRMKNEAQRSRFDLYRSQRVYEANQGAYDPATVQEGEELIFDQEGGDGFLINDENFIDSEREDGDDTDAGELAARRQSGMRPEGGFGAGDAEAYPYQNWDGATDEGSW